MCLCEIGKERLSRHKAMFEECSHFECTLAFEKSKRPTFGDACRSSPPTSHKASHKCHKPALDAPPNTSTPTRSLYILLHLIF